jgi:hypothetical protein
MTRDEVLEEVMTALLCDGYREDGETACLIRALKSKPPEKSPEVALASNPYDTSVMSHAELADAVFDLVHQRDALRAKLDVQEKLAEEALARVKHIEWLQRGAPMKGEDDGSAEAWAARMGKLDP